MEDTRPELTGKTATDYVLVPNELDDQGDDEPTAAPGGGHLAESN